MEEIPDAIEEEGTMLDVEEEGEFKKRWEEHNKKVGGIIALKGLPTTAKTEVAKRIGKWAKCPVLCIQDFVIIREDDDDPSLVLQNGFEILCRVAKRNLSKGVAGNSKLVVIKSRLDSTFELKLLQQLASNGYPLLIIECRITNIYQWQSRLHFFGRAELVKHTRRYGINKEKVRVDEQKVKYDRWYRPRNWIELENFRDEFVDHFDAQALAGKYGHLIRLVVDPYDDIFIPPSMGSQVSGLPEDFIHAIIYLLTAPKTEKEEYYTVQLSQLRPLLFEKRLCFASSKGKRDNLCANGDCVLQTKTLVTDEGDCGRCSKPVVGDADAYACRLCTLVLHKPCAEEINFSVLACDEIWYAYESYLGEKVACKSCSDERKGYSPGCGSCLFQTHLKCGPLPTIIHHDCHTQFLTIHLSRHSFRCQACGYQLHAHAYCCKKYGFYYHLECMFLPVEVMKHSHGGYVHPMKLNYSRHPGDQEEAYWCDVCYKDMDPRLWFYSCQKCPQFAAHIGCTTEIYPEFNNLEDAKFVDQVQTQFEVAMMNKSAEAPAN